MPTRYAEMMFGPQTRARQEQVNSHIAYAHGDNERMELEPEHQGLIARQRHFFLGSVTPSGWPYIQHRGGPEGFVHVLDRFTLAFADFEGNEQYVSTGNIDHDGRVALFFIDYPTRTRLKVYGRARVVEAADDGALLESLLQVPSGAIKSPCRRGIVIDVEAYDANCRKYIQPRFDRESVDAITAAYRDDLEVATARIAELEAQVAELSG